MLGASYRSPFNAADHSDSQHDPSAMMSSNGFADAQALPVDDRAHASSHGINTSTSNTTQPPPPAQQGSSTLARANSRLDAVAKLRRAASQREMRRTPTPRAVTPTASAENDGGQLLATDSNCAGAAKAQSFSPVLEPSLHAADASFLSMAEADQDTPSTTVDEAQAVFVAPTAASLLRPPSPQRGRLSPSEVPSLMRSRSNRSPLPTLEQLRARVLLEREAATSKRSSAAAAASAAARAYALEKLLGSSSREGRASPASDGEGGLDDGAPLISTPGSIRRISKVVSRSSREAPLGGVSSTLRDSSGASSLRRSRTIGGLSAVAETQRKVAFLQGTTLLEPPAGEPRRSSRRFAQNPLSRSSTSPPTSPPRGGLRPTTTTIAEVVEPANDEHQTAPSTSGLERKASQRQLARAQLMRKLSNRSQAAGRAAAGSVHGAASTSPLPPLQLQGSNRATVDSEPPSAGGGQWLNAREQTLQHSSGHRDALSAASPVSAPGTGRSVYSGFALSPNTLAVPGTPARTYDASLMPSNGRSPMLHPSHSNVSLIADESERSFAHSGVSTSAASMLRFRAERDRASAADLADRQDAFELDHELGNDWGHHATNMLSKQGSLRAVRRGRRTLVDRASDGDSEGGSQGEQTNDAASSDDAATDLLDEYSRFDQDLKDEEDDESDCRSVAATAMQSSKALQHGGVSTPMVPQDANIDWATPSPLGRHLTRDLRPESSASIPLTLSASHEQTEFPPDSQQLPGVEQEWQNTHSPWPVSISVASQGSAPRESLQDQREGSDADILSQAVESLQAKPTQFASNAGTAPSASNSLRLDAHVGRLPTKLDALISPSFYAEYGHPLDLQASASPVQKRDQIPSPVDRQQAQSDFNRGATPAVSSAGPVMAPPRSSSLRHRTMSLSESSLHDLRDDALSRARDHVEAGAEEEDSDLERIDQITADLSRMASPRAENGLPSRSEMERREAAEQFAAAEEYRKAKGLYEATRSASGSPAAHPSPSKSASPAPSSMSRFREHLNDEDAPARSSLGRGSSPLAGLPHPTATASSIPPLAMDASRRTHAHKTSLVSIRSASSHRSREEGSTAAARSGSGSHARSSPAGHNAKAASITSVFASPPVPANPAHLHHPPAASSAELATMYANHKLTPFPGLFREDQRSVGNLANEPTEATPASFAPGLAASRPGGHRPAGSLNLSSRPLAQAFNATNPDYTPSPGPSLLEETVTIGSTATRDVAKPKMIAPSSSFLHTLRRKASGLRISPSPVSTSTQAVASPKGAALHGATHRKESSKDLSNGLHDYPNAASRMLPGLGRRPSATRKPVPPLEEPPIQIIGRTPPYFSESNAEDHDVSLNASFGDSTTIDAGQSAREEPRTAQLATLTLAPATAAMLHRYSHMLTSPNKDEGLLVPELSPAQVERPPRQLVRAAPVLQVVTNSTVKDRFLFLFSDILVVARPENPAPNETLTVANLRWKFAAKNIIELHQAKLHVPSDRTASVKPHPLMAAFVRRFLRDPDSALDQVIRQSSLPKNADTIAKLLFQTPELDRECLTEYLCSSAPGRRQILEAYVGMQRITGVSIESALRMLLIGLRFPREADTFETLLTAFAKRWTSSNVGLIKQSFSAELAGDLVLAIMALNDALHTPTPAEELARARGQPPEREYVDTPRLFSDPQPMLDKQPFLSAFRARDPQQVLSDRTLLRIYTSVAADPIMQAKSKDESGPRLTVKLLGMGMPSKLTYGKPSEPIVVSIPAADPELTIRLYGQELSFEPPVLTFERSDKCSFTITSRSLGPQQAVFVRTGRTARNYVDRLPDDHEIGIAFPHHVSLTVERAFMANCFSLTLPSAGEDVSKRRYMFSVDDAAARRQWTRALKDNIDAAVIARKNLADAQAAERNARDRAADQTNVPGPVATRRAAETLALHVLRETLIQPDNNASPIATFDARQTVLQRSASSATPGSASKGALDLRGGPPPARSAAAAVMAGIGNGATGLSRAPSDSRVASSRATAGANTSLQAPSTLDRNQSISRHYYGGLGKSETDLLPPETAASNSPVGGRPPLSAGLSPSAHAPDVRRGLSPMLEVPSPSESSSVKLTSEPMLGEELVVICTQNSLLPLVLANRHEPRS
ncbi:hypothetical protein IE81DRAFT_326448 [Ceraceosorus guamensis]|uniref:SEC7 domain-containing protein n=1 Tax=Ceraceosorus guamensis TaxID=1522189 RepID=A0A316VPE7_9BASI|nr:hypothetical protein IE81DRAFT_326448 [Ceraceosorus guamensis]PWN39509.1 hypothetical protein IE81DRAFT_326448 [Ceraceosorus guamensis]